MEFRYWDVELDQADTQQLMDVTKQAIAYAFFYLDDEALEADYGAYTPGAVPSGAITEALTKGQTPMSLCALALA